MKGNPIVRNALAEFEANELIIASKLYKEKLLGKISEAAYYKTLQRMCESGELVKIAKGTYHLPKISKYGLVPPSEKEIVTAFTNWNPSINTFYAFDFNIVLAVWYFWAFTNSCFSVFYSLNKLRKFINIMCSNY